MTEKPKSEREWKLLMKEYENVSEDIRHRNQRAMYTAYFTILTLGFLLPNSIDYAAAQAYLKLAVLSFAGFLLVSSLSLWMYIDISARISAKNRMNEIEDRVHVLYPDVFAGNVKIEDRSDVLDDTTKSFVDRVSDFGQYEFVSVWAFMTPLSLGWLTVFLVSLYLHHT